jgi:hypothetical protein
MRPESQHIWVKQWARGGVIHVADIASEAIEPGIEPGARCGIGFW